MNFLNQGKDFIQNQLKKEEPVQEEQNGEQEEKETLKQGAGNQESERQKDEITPGISTILAPQVEKNNSSINSKKVQVVQPQKESSFGMFTSGVAQFGDSMLQKGKQTLTEGLQIAEKKGKEFKQYTEQKINIFGEQLKNMMMQQKKQINIWMRSKFLEKLLLLVEKGRPIAKEKLKDPEMCQFVKNGVDDFVDTFWPDLQDEVKYLVQCQIDKPSVTVVDRQIPCICRPFNCIRATFLYAMMPYDRSIWKQVKTFWWWFFTLIESVPIYGFQPLYYFFMYICIDKDDEYQLVTYILDYKSMQFITQGVISASTAYLQYYNCTTLNKQDLRVRQDCFNEGPGAPRGQALYDFGVFCLQLLMVWLAFFMLPCSTQKGKPKFLYLDDKQDQKAEAEAEQKKGFDFKKGGILIKFMIYDIVCFSASLAVMFVTYNYAGVTDFDYAAPFIYFGKTVYGFLSLPFLIFKSQFLVNMLTRSQATAYDRKGNTVPAQDGIDIEYQDKYGQQSSNLDDLDIEDMFGQQKQVENLE